MNRVEIRVVWTDENREIASAVVQRSHASERDAQTIFARACAQARHAIVEIAKRTKKAGTSHF